MSEENVLKIVSVDKGFQSYFASGDLRVTYEFGVKTSTPYGPLFVNRGTAIANRGTEMLDFYLLSEYFAVLACKAEILEIDATPLSLGEFNFIPSMVKRYWEDPEYYNAYVGHFGLRYYKDEWPNAAYAKWVIPLFEIKSMDEANAFLNGELSEMEAA